MALTLQLNTTLDPDDFDGGIIIDETSLLQNYTQSFGIAGDQNDTDIVSTLIDSTANTGLTIPTAFESRLVSLGLGGVTPTYTALSGFTGTSGTQQNGANLLNISGGTYLDLLFSDVDGNLLNGDDSGLTTIDGSKIWLYTDTTNNNVVLGRKDNGDGVATAADETGTIVFAAYLEEVTGGAKVWMILREPLTHDVGGSSAPDDAVDLAGVLYVTATQNLSFDFAGAPSGQHYFLMYRSSSGDNGLVVTGMDPDKVPENQANTVNTSQGGGPTTLGTDSQGMKAGTGLIFTFVTNPNNDFTVPNLANDENNYDDEGNILFGGLFDASGASVTISQTTPPKPITVKLSAFTTDNEAGTNGSADGGVAGAGFFDGLLNGDGIAVDGADDLGYIQSVTLRNADGTVVTVPDGGGTFAFENISSNISKGGYSVTFTLTDDLEDGVGGEFNRTVTVSGSLVTIEYTLLDGTTHNRLVVENAGTGNSTFDIGGIGLPNVVAQPVEVGSAFVFEDDAPTLKTAQPHAVDEDGLTGGIAGGPSASGTFADLSGEAVTATGSLSAIFDAGNDGLQSYGLSDTQADIDLIAAFSLDGAGTDSPLDLKSKGGDVEYDVDGNTLWGFVDGNGLAGYQTSSSDRAVFKLELFDSDADTFIDSYRFTLLDQLDHLALDGAAGDNSENDILLHLGSVLKITDKDGDFITAQSAFLAITVDDDTPTHTGNAVTDAVDEDGLPTGIGDSATGDFAVPNDDGDASEATTTGSISGIFQSGADEPLVYSLSDVTTGVKAYPSDADAAADTNALTLKSKGGDVLFDVINGTTLWGFVNVGGASDQFDDADRAVFKFVLTNTETGAYEFTLLDQLDHPAGSNENDIVLNLGAILQATDKDGDTVTADADQLRMLVDDDIPTATGAAVTDAVDEDGLATGIGDSATGDLAVPADDGDASEATTNGSISGIFQSGADEPLVYGLSDVTTGVKAYPSDADAVADTNAFTLKSRGDNVSYDVQVNTLWGYVDGNGDSIRGNGGPDRDVFSLVLTDTTAGTYTFTLLDQLDHPTLDGVAGDNTENDLVLNLGSVLQATDKDGDTVTAEANKLRILVDDDLPTATGAAVNDAVDEDGLAGGNAGGTGDLAVPNDDSPVPDNNEATTTGNIAGIFVPGADEPLTYGLSNVTTGVQVFDSAGTPVALKSKGGTVLYDVISGTTLWGFVNVDGSATEFDGTDRAVFKLDLTDTTTGAYKFTLLDQLDHPDTVGGNDTENELLLHLGSVLQATDKDGDTVTAAAEKLVITVDDDTPVVTAKSALVYANDRNPPPNTDPGGTGVFAYAIGVDERLGTTYSSTNSDFGTITLSGTVGGTPISVTSVVWLSETDSQAVFDVNFTYVSNNPVPGASTVVGDNEVATLTFNKLAGTYTLYIPEIESFSILQTSTPGNPLQGYLLNSSTTQSSNPPVSVMTLASDFFVQFEGFGVINGTPQTFDYDPGTGLFSNDQRYVTISSESAGVSSDTLQSDEVIDFDFFTQNPQGFVNSTIPKATAKAIFIEFEQVGPGAGKDMLVVLKLVNDNDPSDTINRTFIVGNSTGNDDIINTDVPTYDFFAQKQNGIVVFESNDYNFDATKSYSIMGAQVVTSTQGESGQGYNLNGAIDNPATIGTVEGGTTNTLVNFGGDTTEGNNEPIKIINIGFVASTTPDAHLVFSVPVRDADGDVTAAQTLDVTVIGGDGTTASADPDTFVINDAASGDLLNMVMHVIDGGFATTVDKLDMAAGGGFFDGGGAADMADFIADADLKLDGNNYDFYFADFGGNGYLAFDADGIGITTIVELVGVTNMVAGDII